MAEQAIEVMGSGPRVSRSLWQRAREGLAQPYLVPLMLGAIPLTLVVGLALLVFYSTFVPRLPTTLEWIVNWTRAYERKDDMRFVTVQEIEKFMAIDPVV